MNEYITADGGMKVERYGNGLRILYATADGFKENDEDSRFLPGFATSAVREFFRAEEDESLGRWRYDELPEYVAYWHPVLQRLTVIWEPQGGSTFFKRDDDLTYAGNPGKVARAFFDAHPEPKPKPWHEAKHGDVWALTCKGVEEVWFVRKNRFRDIDGLGIRMPLDNTLITAGRRIWPTEES